MQLRWVLMGMLMSVAVVAAAHAEYHGFNTAKGSDGVVQEVRWPYWAESTYNALYSQTITGSDGASCYFYGGVVFASPNYPAPRSHPASIIWSFWPPHHTQQVGAAVKAQWTAPNMYAPPHIGEGASGKVSGTWPLLQTNQWYRFALRVWRPADATPDLSYAAQWMRDPATGEWYHIATMRLPFAAVGITPLGGFQEDFSHGNRNPRRTDYRNVYYRSAGHWLPATEFSPSTRQRTEKGTSGLIDHDSAAFFETSSGEDYHGNMGPGSQRVTLTMRNQPPTVPLDPLVVRDPGAAAFGDQLLVHWDLPATSSPQFAYRIEVFDNRRCTGSPIATVHDIDPEARQKLLKIPAVAAPGVRLTLTDIFDQARSVVIEPDPVSPSPAAHASGTVHGLNYRYFELSTQNLPDFAALKPVLEGAVDEPDLTMRRRRKEYAVNFTGYLRVPRSGLYTFTLKSCDGSRLTIDGKPVVNWDGVHSPAGRSGYAALAAGVHALNLQYFFNEQNRNAGDLSDSLQLSYAGPGIALTPIPAEAYFRTPAEHEPTVAIVSPPEGRSVADADVAVSAKIAASENVKIDRVQYYVGDTYWGQSTTAPYAMRSLLWAAPANRLRARVFYNGHFTLDSPVHTFATHDLPLSPWEFKPIGEHQQPVGAHRQRDEMELIGDGLNLLGQPMTGDCTLIAHVAQVTENKPLPDGTWPGGAWEAGIIMRDSLDGTPGMPLGDNGHRFAAVFCTVNQGVHYQNNTMANAGGGHWSKGLPRTNTWLKLQRVGDEFTASVSSNGVNWTVVNTQVLKGVRPQLWAGVFTYAASSQNTNVHRAKFDHVSLSGK